MENYQNNGQPGDNSMSQPSVGLEHQRNYQNNYQYGGQIPPQGQPPYYGGNQAYSAGGYPPTGYVYPNKGHVPEEISTWKYLGMMWIGVIPIVGIIMILIWAFSDDQINRRNYARAILLNIVISFVFAFLTWGILMAFLVQMMDMMSQPMYMR